MNQILWEVKDYKYCPENKRQKLMTTQQSSQVYLKNPYVFNSFPAGDDGRQMGQLVLARQNDNFLQKDENKINAKNSYQNNSFNQNINQLPNESKISNTRNHKHSLPQSNQSQQIKKQQQRQHYRKELQAQIKADKQRKQRQKQKIEKQQLERQKKFYAEIKSKQKKSKVQESNIVLRSSQGKRKNRQSLIVERDQSMGKNKSMLEGSAEYPKIIKRGGYNNHSVLDNYNLNKSLHQQPKHYASNKPSQVQNNSSSINSSPMKSLQLSQREGQMYMVQMINPEEERIRSIIKMQEKMLKKLDNVKEQINKINKGFDYQKEVQYIRNILRSKPIKVDPWNTRNQHNFSNYDDFYRFPKFESETLTRNSNRNKRSRLHSVINQHNDQPQRTFTEQNPEKKFQQSNITINQKNPKRKRETKTQNRSNDKNFANSTEQNEENDDEIRIPVVLQQQD